MPACFSCHTLLIRPLLTDGQRRPSHRITPSSLSSCTKHTLSFFTSVTFSVGGVTGLPSPLCRMYLPWVSVVRGSSRLSLSLMARRSRRKYVGLTATHGPSSRTNRPNRPTPPPPPRLFPASHTLLLRSTCHPSLPSPPHPPRERVCPTLPHRPSHPSMAPSPSGLDSQIRLSSA